MICQPLFPQKNYPKLAEGMTKVNIYLGIVNYYNTSNRKKKYISNVRNYGLEVVLLLKT